MAQKRKNAASLLKVSRGLKDLPIEIDRKQSVPVKVDKNLLRRTVQKLDTPQLRRAAVVVSGVAVLAAAGSTTARYQFHRNIVSKELKKQLAPLHAEIAELRRSVDDLHAELEEARRREQ